MYDYTVYLRKTDLPVAFGTARKCAAALGMTTGSFYSMVSRVAIGKNKKYVVMKEADHE